MQIAPEYQEAAGLVALERGAGGGIIAEHGMGDGITPAARQFALPGRFRELPKTLFEQGLGLCGVAFVEQQLGRDRVYQHVEAAYCGRLRQQARCAALQASADEFGFAQRQ